MGGKVQCLTLLLINKSDILESYESPDCKNSKLHEEVLCGKWLPGVQKDRGVLRKQNNGRVS